MKRVYNNRKLVLVYLFYNTIIPLIQQFTKTLNGFIQNIEKPIVSNIAPRRDIVSYG